MRLSGRLIELMLLMVFIGCTGIGVHKKAQAISDDAHSFAITVADSLISEGKYWSALKHLNQIDPDNTIPTVALKKQQIMFDYYISVIGGSVFALADFNEPTDISTVRGKAGEYQGTYFNSDSIFKNIIELYPKRWEGPYGLGMYYYWCSNHCGCCPEGCEDLIPKAADYFADAQRLGADDGHSNFVIGLSYHYKGNLEKAVNYYVQAVKRDIDYPTSHYNLAIALLSLGNAQDALLPAMTAYALYSDKYLKADAASLVGSVQKNLGNIPDAIDAYRSALNINPHHATSIDLILPLMFDQDDWESAHEVTLAYIQSAPTDYETYLTIIQPWYRSSKPHNIMAVMDQARSNATELPEEAIITFFSAEFLKVLGETSQALERYVLAEKLLLDSGDKYLELLNVAQEEIANLSSQ